MSQTAPAPGTPDAIPRRSHTVRNALLGGLVALVALGAGGAAWAAQAGWSTDTPQVLGISPPPGSRNVAGDTPISIAFNMPMNPDSVRGALKIDPPSAGTVTWEGNTLVFHPQPGYQRGMTYTVEVGTAAGTPLFRGLAAPATTRFKTAGLPSLYRSVPPADAANVPTDTMITLQFSQPMVALAALDSLKDVGNAVQISPAAAGHWQWLGSTTLAYRTSALDPATSYSVSVSKSLADYTGSVLDRDYNFKFTTVRPAVVATQPETETEFAGTRDPIRVVFNSPVDRSSAESGFRLAPSAPGTFQWAADSTVFTYTVSAPLPADTAIQATVAGVKPAAGDLAQAAPYAWSFRTTPHPAVAEIRPKEGEQAVPAGNELMVRYSAPLSNTNEELRAGLRIDPPVKGAAAYSYDGGTTLNIFAPLAPSTAYTVTVGAGGGYRDRDGQPVAPTTWHFRTSRTKPDAHALNNDGLVTYYAGLPTRLFVSAVNVESFLRFRVWKLSGRELDSYLDLPSAQRMQYTPQSTVARTWDISVTYHLDQLQTLNPYLSLDGKADRLPPGFYYLRISSPQTANSPGTINGTAVVVGNAGLVMKRGGDDVLVWGTDMGTGKPLSGRTVRVLAGDIEAPITLDANGIGRLSRDWGDNSQQRVILDDGTDAAMVSSSWNDDIGPWNFDLSFKDRRYNSGSAIYTDRPIYRAGQTVYFKGITRKDDDGRYSIPGQPVSVVVNDTEGREVYSATLPLSPFGTFTAQYQLPEYAPTGTYYISCRCTSEFDGAGISFQVNEYRKPEYLVTV
ncbi:MAG TPA: Ig-like domain-containing protein, partial [Chloroflexia bacterium]|nr:Ig-like domain-containing protein [Chloroflexia bacterium]